MIQGFIRAGVAALSLALAAGAAAQQCGMSPIATMGGVITAGAALANGRVVIVRGVTLELLDLSDPGNPVILDRRPSIFPGVWGVPEQLVGSGNVVCVILAGEAHLFDVSTDRFMHTDVRKVRRADGTTSNARGAVLDGDRLILTSNLAYEILDVSDPSSPLSLIRQGAWWTTGAIADGDADRVAVFSSSTIDIADLQRFRYLQMANPNSGCNTLTAEGTRMFLFDPNAGTGIYDISGSTIRRVGSLGPLGCPPAVTERAGVAYAVESTELEALDLTDPANPRVIGRVALPGSYKAGIATSAGGLMLTGSARVPIIDTSDPANPRIAGYYPELGETYIDGTGHGDVILAVTADYRKLVSIEYVDGELRRLNETPMPGNQRLYSIAVDGNVLVGATSAGLQVIDITNPRSPVLRGVAPTSVGSRQLIDLDGTLACISSSNGISLVDVSDPDHPVTRGLIQVSFAYDIAIDSGIVAALSSSRMIVWDISDPTAPRNRATVPVFDASLDIQGDLIAVCTSTGFHLYDRNTIHLPNPVPLGGARGPLYDVVLRGNRAWTADPAVINLENPGEPFVEASTARFRSPAPAEYQTVPLTETIARVDRATGIAVFSTDVDGIPTLRRGLPSNSVRGCLGEPLELSIEAYSRTPMTYQWFRSGVPILGATGPTLRFERLRPMDLTGYSVEITNACGTLREPIQIPTFSGRITACRGDFNCDNFIDWSDYAEFVGAFEAGDLKADRNGDDFVDFFDYVEFVDRFEQGC